MADKKEMMKETMRIDLIASEAQAGGAVKGMPMNKTRVQMMPHPSVPMSVLRARYQLLLESVYDAALITRISGSIIDANARAVEFLHHDRADLLKLAIHDVIAGADITLMDTLTQNLTTSRFTVIQAYCQRKDGTTFPAEIAVNKLQLDEMCLCFFIRDITARMQAQEMLRTVHTAIHHAMTGIVIADLQFICQYANPAFTMLMGFAGPDDLLSMDLRTIIPKEVSTELIETVLHARKAWSHECVLHRRNGEECFVKISAACNMDDDDIPIGIVLSVVDITDQKEVEKALGAARREIEQLREQLSWVRP